MSVELALIIGLTVALAGCAVTTCVLCIWVVDMAKRIIVTEKTLATFMKEEMRLHDTVEKRINTIERKVNNANAVTLPKYEKALRDLHDRQTAETRAWDESADEALRNFEKECGE